MIHRRRSRVRGRAIDGNWRRVLQQALQEMMTLELAHDDDVVEWRMQPVKTTSQVNSVLESREETDVVPLDEVVEDQRRVNVTVQSKSGRAPENQWTRWRYICKQAHRVNIGESSANAPQ